MWVCSLGWEDPLRVGNCDPFQYSCLDNLMDRGAWWATVCGVMKESDTTEWLSTHIFLVALVAILILALKVPSPIKYCRPGQIRKLSYLRSGWSYKGHLREVLKQFRCLFLVKNFQLHSSLQWSSLAFPLSKKGVPFDAVLPSPS